MKYFWSGKVSEEERFFFYSTNSDNSNVRKTNMWQAVNKDILRYTASY